MSSLLALPLLWAQEAATNQVAREIPRWLRNFVFWAFLYGEPGIIPENTGGISLLNGWLVWIRSISLLCLIGWVGSWLVTAIKERYLVRNRWYDYAALGAFVMIFVTVLLRTLEDAKQIPTYKIGPIGFTSLLAYLVVAVLILWAELGLWRTIRRFGSAADILVLVGVHVALLFGLGVGYLMHSLGFLSNVTLGQRQSTTVDGLVYGARLSATYMGYVVLLRLIVSVLREVFSVRGRRLFAIARLTVHEANRRMWAPWVVITVFGLVLAFTHWFLVPPRPAEMGRLFVGTLTLLCSLLLTAMVTLLTPLSLPTDIQQQTIYTVVTKPVRRLELIWGRMIGFMFLVTILIVAFGGISLIYLRRTVGATIENTEKAALKAKDENRTRDFRILGDQADQLRSRMKARVPVKGSLSFLDSRGTPHALGIDVGQEQNMKEPRSHIEGATAATAIWSFGIVPDPFSPATRPRPIDRRIPVKDFLRDNTVEGELNRLYELQALVVQAQKARGQAALPPAEVTKLESSLDRNQKEIERVRGEYEALQKKSADLEAEIATAGGDEARVKSLKEQLQALHSPAIPIEMTFNVYRTTKGKVGEPVLAEMHVVNPRTGADNTSIFPVKEYYTNRQFIPAAILAGGEGDLRVEIRCIPSTQYLGMAESDLYLLSSNGLFGVNYMKGLFGVWLQAMVLTAIGVFAGTFLSWPVALLTTIAFFFAGQLAYSFLIDFTRQSILGGGPFESLVRLLTHDNQMSDLAPTAGALIAKTLDSLVMPLMSPLVYLVPNFQALDVSNTVADGFGVSWGTILANTLLAIAYALPFSIVGYFILKNREVAA
ncbi:hypothetical protein [Aquisphaera insulae]|uniref:hypothetical protein n=1 Tax=Aquisphaera insulae TaxID=2712864 RepID=UPI0013ED6558|nr:hypothetical protein [Aquisphaera insulae]